MMTPLKSKRIASIMCERNVVFAETLSPPWEREGSLSIEHPYQKRCSRGHLAFRSFRSAAKIIAAAARSQSHRAGAELPSATVRFSGSPGNPNRRADDLFPTAG